MNKVCLLLIVFCFGKLSAQFSDSFTDGNYSQNPIWQATSGDWIVDHNQLKSAKTGATEFGISTELGPSVSAWEFRFGFGFNPSSANYVHVFLSADSQIVEKSLNGVYVKLGNTLDEISLYKLVSGVSTEIISGVDKLMDKTQNAYDVRVILRNDSWFLYQKDTSKQSYTYEGTSKYTSTLLPYFGIVVKQSTSNAGKHTFDNIYAGQARVDSLGPKISSALIINQTELKLTFNEDIKFLNNTDIEINGQNAQGILGTLPTNTINISTNILPKNSAVKIIVRNLQDLLGNITLMDSISLFNAQFDTAVFGDIIITEIMSIPTPGLCVLPNAEYVEIYNRSAKYLQLDNYSFSDASSTVKLPTGTLAPNEYAILSKSSDDFSAFGKWIPLSSLPSLNNDGDALRIESKNGALIYNVDYSLDWHSGELQKKGGYSLEQRDTQKYCIGAINWGSSISPNGGTPGKTNSLAGTLTSLTKFNVKYAYVNGTQIHVVFNENVGPCNNCIFTLSPNVAISSRSYAGKEWILNTASALPADQIYELTISNVNSCDGRLLENSKIKLGQSTNKDLVKYDLLINEILFDPKGFDEDFVEIYNRSQKIIDLNEVFIANTNDQGLLKDAYLISSTPFQILPGQYIAITKSAKNIIDYYKPTEPQNIISILNMPTFSNDKGTCLLVSRKNVELHRFTYSNKMHYELLLDEEGVSLERTHTDTTNENWTSASYKVNYATPGYINSQYRAKNGQINNLASLLSKTVSPDGDGWEDQLQIELKVENLPATVTLSIFNEYGQMIDKPIENRLVGALDIIAWDGIKDGGQVPMGNYIALIELVDYSGKVSQQKLIFSVLKRR